MHASGIEPAPCEDMVHQISMNTSIAVLERMNIDESKREHRGRQDGIELCLCRLIESNQARHERSKVLMPRADMIRDRSLRFAIVFTDKAAFLAIAHFYKPFVTDHDALQTQKFLFVERRTPRFADSAAPSLDAILRRAFAFDDVTRL